MKLVYTIYGNKGKYFFGFQFVLVLFLITNFQMIVSNRKKKSSFLHKYKSKKQIQKLNIKE